MTHKIRLRKPTLTKRDGPYARVNAWLRQFYTEHSADASNPTTQWLDW